MISSFDQPVGIDSASTYTMLALQTISKQFECLKDNGETRLSNWEMRIVLEVRLNVVGLNIWIIICSNDNITEDDEFNASHIF